MYMYIGAAMHSCKILNIFCNVLFYYSGMCNYLLVGIHVSAMNSYNVSEVGVHLPDGYTS